MPIITLASSIEAMLMLISTFLQLMTAMLNHLWMTLRIVI